MAIKIAAVVLNYHHHLDTERCIQHLLMSDLGKDLEVICVDNSNDFESINYLKEKFSKVIFIKNDKNLGFAGGNNLGIKLAIKNRADYILIINPDVEIPTDFFSPLLKNFTNSKTGLVGPAILHTQKNKKVYGLEGKVDWSLGKPEHRNIKKLENKSPINADFITFACVLIKPEVFRKVGLIDDGYFMYFEDVDYCLSARKSSYNIVLDPSVVVLHNTSSSFSRPADKLVISFKSHLRFINKWLPVFSRIKPIVYISLLYPYLYLLWTYHYYKYSRHAKNDVS